MTEQSEKSIQELRDEITRLENTVAQQREIIKFRGDELNKRSPEALDRLRLELSEALDGREAHLQRAVQLRRQIEACVGAVLGYGPKIENIEDCLPSVTARVKDLQKQTEELRQIPVNKNLLEDIRKERDEMIMRALDAEKKLREQTQLLQSHLSGAVVAKLQAELKAAVEAKVDMANGSAVVQKRYLDLEYKHRDLDIEHADLKKRHQQLQDAEANRTWASTDKNAYDSLLALRDVIVPHVALGNAREAILHTLEVAQREKAIAQEATREFKNTVEILESELKHEEFLKKEIYTAYAELRRLFNLEHLGAIDPKKVHASIKHMLTRCNEETNKLLEKLENERALACAEIRRLTDIIKAEGDK